MLMMLCGISEFGQPHAVTRSGYDDIFIDHLDDTFAALSQPGLSLKRQKSDNAPPPRHPDRISLYTVRASFRGACHEEKGFARDFFLSAQEITLLSSTRPLSFCV